MKTKIFLSIVSLFLFFTISCSQTKDTDSKFNLSFENIQNGKPQGWYTAARPGYYSVSLDSVNVKSGKYAITIESIGDSVRSQAISFVLPNYEGKSITLSGYIKTENVTDGYAGLWMRIDPRIAFDNMYQNGVTGTTDWNRYEITLSMKPEETQQIIIGGMLVGKGKMWLDDLQVTIDGKDIKDAKPYEIKRLPAEKDKEFDNGSHIVFPELNDQKINDLELLGRIWGFLKYHHPEVGKGNYNWDYELFRMLPEYLKVTETAQRDEILLRWIEKYGKIPQSKLRNETSSDAFLKPDLTWVDNSNINLKLKEAIEKIYRSRCQGDHFYIEVDYTENPIFSNENSYSNIPYPDAGFRLLSLYRFWNMIQYFFPFKYLTDKNWNTVLREYIPGFVLAGTELDYELTALRLIGEINDTHAQLLEGRRKLDSLRGYWMAPFQVRFIENHLVVTKHYCSKSQDPVGLKVGDVITSINGKSVEAILDSIKAYYPASNESARMRDMANDLLRFNKKTILLNYISSNQLKQNEVFLMSWDSLYQYMYPKDTAKCYKFLSKEIGYVTLKSIKEEDIEEIKKEFKETKGIIIDIRNYPSFFVPYLLGSYFVSKDTPFIKFTKGNPDNPGEFTFTRPYEIPEPEESYHGKLVVIVNEDTQSQAEFTAMAFQAGNNTTIIGSQTAGADGNVSLIVLPGGIKTWISGLGVYYPDGKATQRIGIVPDIVVKPTVKGIREGRDELLEKAIEIIKQETNAI